jgi:hypothetical protein
VRHFAHRSASGSEIALPEVAIRVLMSLTVGSEAERREALQPPGADALALGCGSAAATFLPAALTSPARPPKFCHSAEA